MKYYIYMGSWGAGDISGEKVVSEYRIPTHRDGQYTWAYIDAQKLEELACGPHNMLIKNFRDGRLIAFK